MESTGFALPAIVTALALIEYMFFTFRVGLGRGKYGVPAPAVTGHEIWERMFRVQQNTLEQIIIFIPSLWMFAHFWSPMWAALVGLLFLIGRPIYYVSYVADPGKRTIGFVLSFLSNVVLVVGTLVGAALHLV